MIVHNTSRSGDLYYVSVDGSNSFETFSVLGTLTGVGDGGNDAVARFDREAYIPSGATSRTYDGGKVKKGSNANGA